MAVDERSRHELYRRLDEVLGPDAATTLIEHLPSVGWADVATKHDLTALEERMELRFARVDDRLDRIEEGFEERLNGVNDRIEASASGLRAMFEHELRKQTMALVFGMVSVVMTMAALAFALVRFT